MMKDLADVLKWVKEQKSELQVEENLRCYNPVRVGKIEKLTQAETVIQNFISVNNCVSGSYFTALKDARKMLQESLLLKEKKWKDNHGSMDEHEEYWINENRINRCREAIPFLERLIEVK